MLNSIFANDPTIIEIVIMLATAGVIGIAVSLLFGWKNPQSKSFALTLAMLPMVSGLIIFMVNDHLGVSVAVAGAFTLVRFRSVAGTGRELIAIFTAMMLGLVLGMGYIVLAVLALVAVALMVVFLTLIGFGETKAKKIVIRIPENLDYNGIFDDIFSKYCKNARLTEVGTKNMGTVIELTYTAFFNDKEFPKKFIDEIRVRNGNLPVAVKELSGSDSI